MLDFPCFYGEEMEYSIAIGERKKTIKISKGWAVNVLHTNPVFVSVNEKEESDRIFKL